MFMLNLAHPKIKWETLLFLQRSFEMNYTEYNYNCFFCIT